MKYPEYNQSLLALASSILSHYGVKTHHKTLKQLDLLLTKNYKNVVVMLFDGMGTSILEKHLPKDSFLRRHFVDTISSVFPPTTTAATTTMTTGLSPIEHGWLGWSLYFDELQANVDLFPNTLSGTNDEVAADYNVATRYIPYVDLFEKINDATHGEVHAQCISPFSEYKSKSVNEICNTVKSICLENGRNYIYTYWDQPDHDMHEYGTWIPQITEHMIQINNEVESMCEGLTDTLVIVTADHGHIDTQWLCLSDYPEVLECLTRIPSIEARAMSFFIHPEKKTQFVSAFKKHFGSYYQLFSKEKVYEEKLFGDGDAHSRANGFIGDYLAVAISNISIAYEPRPYKPPFKGVHAGLTEDEVNIPLIMITR